MKTKLALPILLIVSLVLVQIFYRQAQGQTPYSLALEGLTWNHSTISVLLTPQDGASWWKPSYLNATLRAIGEWNNAIQNFASNYSNFSYLSTLRMNPTVSHTTSYSFDVYVTWTGTLSPGSGEIGLTQTAYDSSGIIINSTISLSVKDTYGYVLNDVDMQNVALHEFGHSLGLGHSNYSDDIMYATYTPNQQVRALSTLDLYGVSTVFQWMAKSPNNPRSPQQSSVTLPSNIPYQYMSISYANLPPSTQSPTPSTPLSPNPYQTWIARGQTLLNHILQFFLLPEILIPLLLAISAGILAIFITTRNARKSAHHSP